MYILMSDQLDSFKYFTRRVKGSIYGLCSVHIMCVLTYYVCSGWIMCVLGGLCVFCTYYVCPDILCVFWVDCVCSGWIVCVLGGLCVFWVDCLCSGWIVCVPVTQIKSLQINSLFCRLTDFSLVNIQNALKMKYICSVCSHFHGFCPDQLTTEFELNQQVESGPKIYKLLMKVYFIKVKLRKFINHFNQHFMNMYLRLLAIISMV